MKAKKILFITIFSTILLGGCQMQNNEANEPAASTSTSSSQSSPAKSSTTTTTNEKVNWTLEQAIASFEKDYPSAAITALKLDTSFGRYFYEIEGVDNDKEYEVKINATSGELTKEKEEQLDPDERNGVKKREDALELTNILSIEEVSKIAEKEANKGQAQDWQLEKEGNLTYWEVKVADKTTEMEIKINAKTGEVLEID